MNELRLPYFKDISPPLLAQKVTGKTVLSPRLVCFSRSGFSMQYEN